MALIGSHSVLNKQPGRRLGGNSTAHASGIGTSTAVRTCWATASDWRRWSLRDQSGGTFAAQNRTYGKVQGYGSNVYAFPDKSGGIAAVNALSGTGTISASGALGKNAASDLTGTGTISATGQTVVSGTAALTGTGTISANVVAALAADADLAGTGTWAGTLLAKGNILAALTGTGTLTGTRYATGALAADIAPLVDLEAAGFSTYLLDSELVETGMTVRQAMRLISAAVAGEVSGAETSTITFRSAVADDADRIVATVSGGNRTAITYDLD